MAEKEQAEVAEETEEKQEETPVKPSNELKVVIMMKEDKLMIGVQSPECDPVYETLTGTLTAALKRIPKLVSEAKEKWATSPRNPDANLPKPEPRPAPARASTASKTKPKSEQPTFF